MKLIIFSFFIFTVSLATILALVFTVLSGAVAVTYHYDKQNRLIRARFDDGTVEEYTYDQAGNRQTKTLGTSDNHPPVAEDQAVATDENVPVAITLSATDLDSDPLTYLIETNPGHGVLSGTLPNLTYTPNTQYDGTDLFRFKANDGEDDSNLATITITLGNVNLIPVAFDQCLSTRINTPVAITLHVEDPDQGPACVLRS